MILSDITNAKWLLFYDQQSNDYETSFVKIQYQSLFTVDKEAHYWHPSIKLLKITPFFHDRIEEWLYGFAQRKDRVDEKKPICPNVLNDLLF